MGLVGLCSDDVEDEEERRWRKGDKEDNVRERPRAFSTSDVAPAATAAAAAVVVLLI